MPFSSLLCNDMHVFVNHKQGGMTLALFGYSYGGSQHQEPWASPGDRR